MKNAILLPGLYTKEEYYDKTLPANSNNHWFPWLQRQLILRDLKADSLEIPFTFKLEWQTWVTEVERFDITPDTLLVGHSMGGGFWLRYLSEHPEISVDKIVLVAPWLDVDKEEKTDFFEFKVNSNIVNQANGFIVFYSDNDFASVQHSVDFIKEQVPKAKYREFHNYGHFCNRDLGTDAFPELLNTLIK